MAIVRHTPSMPPRGSIVPRFYSSLIDLMRTCQRCVTNGSAPGDILRGLWPRAAFLWCDDLTPSSMSRAVSYRRNDGADLIAAARLITRAFNPNVCRRLR